MARTSGQKLKLLYLKDFFTAYTDEEHPATMQDIISYLESNGIKAERKSIYEDIEALRLYGMDIMTTREKSYGYYLAERTFELAELKMLVDSVQSSKFITREKTLELIKKLESQASVYQATQLQRQVYVSGRIKRDNKSILYSIDAIHKAIGENKKIAFRYFEYSVKKERVYRNAGSRYIVSPIALTWEDENYYLVAYDGAAGMIKHFRCDKMTGTEVTDEPRDGKESYGDFDIDVYTQKVFGMFTGQERRVTLKFENRLAGAAIDRFGRDIAIISSGDDHFVIDVDVIVSPQFFGWVLGFGAGVEITAPDDVSEQMREHIEAVRKMYAEK